MTNRSSVAATRTPSTHHQAHSPSCTMTTLTTATTTRRPCKTSTKSQSIRPRNRQSTDTSAIMPLSSSSAIASAVNDLTCHPMATISATSSPESPLAPESCYQRCHGGAQSHKHKTSFGALFSDGVQARLTTTTLCLALAIALTACPGAVDADTTAGLPCESDSWWDPVRDNCIPCTTCTGDMIPLRPCQLHRDTICGSIYDLKIDWFVLAKTEPNWKERRKSLPDDVDAQFGGHHELTYTHEGLHQVHEEAIPLDWQTGALFLAVLACLLFFIVAACILIHHMRQWRRMERRLDQDVEELSTKLMAKLVEVQTLEGGTFFIGNADALRVPTAQHVLLPAEKPAKTHDRRLLKSLQQPGNVYIEENGSKG